MLVVEEDTELSSSKHSADHLLFLMECVCTMPATPSHTETSQNYHCLSTSSHSIP